MSSSLDQNGVIERKNQTLLDMIWGMLNNSNLPKSLWTKAIKMTMYILNRVSTMVVPKIPFELLKSWKSSLNHACVQGYPFKVRI